MRTRYSTNLSKPFKDCGYSISLQYCFSTTAIFFKQASLKCSEHIRLSFTRTNLAGPPLFSFFTHTCMLYNFGLFTESGKYKTYKWMSDDLPTQNKLALLKYFLINNIACEETLMSSRQLSSD